MRHMRTSTFERHNATTGGQLANILHGHRVDGRSLEQIAYRLQADWGITVSRTTVARWLKATL